MKALSWAPNTEYPAYTHKALESFTPIMETLPIENRDSFIDEVIYEYDCGRRSVANMMKGIYCDWRDVESPEDLPQDEQKLLEACLEPLRQQDKKRLEDFQNRVDASVLMNSVVDSIKNIATLMLHNQALLSEFQGVCDHVLQQNSNMAHSEIAAHISAAAKVMEGDAGWQYFLRSNNYTSSSDAVNFLTNSQINSLMRTGGVELTGPAKKAYFHVMSTVETMDMDAREGFANAIKRRAYDFDSKVDIAKYAFDSLVQARAYHITDVTVAAFDENLEEMEMDTIGVDR